MSYLKGFFDVMQHKQTLEWHGLFFVNIPTPSGCDRPKLRRSTTNGFKSAREALDAIKYSFTPEQLEALTSPTEGNDVCSICRDDIVIGEQYIRTNDGTPYCLGCAKFESTHPTEEKE